MRRPCTYTVTKRGLRGEDTSTEATGWLLCICMLGSATFYFVETPEGEIVRLHDAYTVLRLLPEEDQENRDG